MAAKPRRPTSINAAPGIKMTRDVKLTVQWQELTTKLTDVVAQGFLTALGGDGVSSGISALIGAISSIKVDEEPGAKAWSLAVLCFAWALDELKTLPGTDIGAFRQVIREVLTEAKRQVDEGYEYVPITFVERPTTSPLYQFLRDAIVAQKATFRFGVHRV